MKDRKDIFDDQTGAESHRLYFCCVVMKDRQKTKHIMHLKIKWIQIPVVTATAVFYDIKTFYFHTFELFLPCISIYQNKF